ncbi:DUF2231 domain-containing protein [Caenispirillum salinarum]|uniref:DUF2231 domain-containing protein n=1 Tax=Caenispirillum salinarum TaxID=859058 RepID=UPI00384DB79B
MAQRRARIGDRITQWIEHRRSLDAPGHALGVSVSLPFRLMGRRGKDLRSLLHGTRYGHPLHPLLVTVPVGSWTASVLFDLLEGASDEPALRARAAADMTLGLGCLGAGAAVLTGLVDWQDTHGKARRVGVVHAATNATALGLFLGSLSLRRRGRRREARGVSRLGFATLFAGGYLGGHLAYRRRVGTDHADRGNAPFGFTPVLPATDLPENTPRRVEVDGVEVVLVRHEGAVSAFSDRCSHFGGPLSQGWVFDGGLVCPWHGSRYCLKSGDPLDGPATAPQPRFEVRERDGMIALRRPAPPGDPERVPVETLAPPAPAGEEGDAIHVLSLHHGLMRTLFDLVAATPPEGDARLAVLDELAGEMDMHEKIEHEIFYPAARRVTGMVPSAGAEHRQLADQLAILLTLDTASSEFDAHLRALRNAVEHHAGTEEREMFPAARSLGRTELRSLGRALADRLEDLRRARTQRLIRLGRQVALERGRGRLGRAINRGA